MRLLKHTWLHLTVLLVTTLLSYGQTLQMYFLIDDNALIYKLQHINTYSGLWGKGVVGAGPYRHIIDQFFLFYPLFGTNPLPYFAGGLIFYFFSSVMLYFFVYKVSSHKNIAFASALIFAAGYIASETMFGITNSWQTGRGLIMALFTFWLYFHFIKTQKWLFYILTFLLFYLSLDTVYTRAHGLIFAFLVFDLLFSPLSLRIKDILGLLIRQTPFWIVYYKIYIDGGMSYVQNFGILRIISEVIQQKKYYLLSVPLQNLGNLFIPDIYLKGIDQFLRNYLSFPGNVSLGSILSGLIFIALSVSVILRYRKKEKILVKIIVFSIVWMIGNMVLYFSKDTFLILQSTHRYLSYSFAGLAIYFAVVFYLLFSSTRRLFNLSISYFVPVLFVTAIFLYLGINFEYQFNQSRSYPAKRFFAAFNQAVPIIPKGAVIYIDLANSNKVKGEYNNFFGGMFSEAGNFAIYNPHLDYSTDFLFTYSLEEVINLLQEGKLKLNNLYTFYYGDHGLVSTSNIVRRILEKGRTEKLRPVDLSSSTGHHRDDIYFYTTSIADQDEKYPEINVQPGTSIPSYVPTQFSFVMKINILPFNEFQDIKVVKNNIKDIQSADRVKIFSYLSSRSRLWKEASVSAASYWKDQQPKYAFDNRLDTAWRGHRGFWDEIFRGRSKAVEYLSLDLKNELNISQLKWISAQSTLAPSHYKILTSLDDKNWDIVKEVTNWTKIAPETEIVDNFPPRLARYIKMEVLATFGNDGPAIEEIEPIEDQYSVLNFDKVKQVEQNPFAVITRQEEYENAENYISQNAKLRVYWMSDADSSQDDNKYTELPIFLDGQEHLYTTALPASGIYWQKITLKGFNFPADISIGKVQLSNKPVKINSN